MRPEQQLEQQKQHQERSHESQQVEKKISHAGETGERSRHAQSHKAATGERKSLQAETNRLEGKQYHPRVEAASRLDHTDRSGRSLKFSELEANSHYKVNGYEYDTDRLGRVKHVHGRLREGDAIRNRYEEGRVGKLGHEGDEGGHLIARRFGGSGEGINMVPQDSNLNHSAWTKMENEWGRALNNHQEVKVDIEPVYQGNSRRPSSFIVTYEIDGEESTRHFKNKPGG
jgi:hypothetical protein